MGVACLSWASVVPVPIANLLFAVASVPLPAVLLGSLVGAAPSALFFAVAGECWCGYCATGELPRASLLVAAGAALLGAVVLRRASRKRWRAALAAVETAAV